MELVARHKEWQYHIHWATRLHWQDLIQKFKATVVSFTHVFHFLITFHRLNTNSWYTTYLELICIDQKNE